MTLAAGIHRDITRPLPGWRMTRLPLAAVLMLGACASVEKKGNDDDR